MATSGLKVTDFTAIEQVLTARVGFFRGWPWPTVVLLPSRRCRGGPIPAARGHASGRLAVSTVEAGIGDSIGRRKGQQNDSKKIRRRNQNLLLKKCPLRERQETLRLVAVSVRVCVCSRMCVLLAVASWLHNFSEPKPAKIKPAKSITKTK